MRIRVHETACEGHGRCYTLSAPAFLEPDDEGYVAIRGRTVDVPRGQEDAARDAVETCPESAIEVLH